MTPDNCMCDRAAGVVCAHHGYLASLNDICTCSHRLGEHMDERYGSTRCLASGGCRVDCTEFNLQPEDPDPRQTAIDELTELIVRETARLGVTERGMRFDRERVQPKAEKIIDSIIAAVQRQVK